MTKTPTRHDYAAALTEVAFLLAAHPELTVPHSIDVTMYDHREQAVIHINLEQGADLAASEDTVRPWAHLINAGDYQVRAHEPDTPKFWTHVGFHSTVFGSLCISANLCHRHAEDRTDAHEPTALTA